MNETTPWFLRELACPDCGRDLPFAAMLRCVCGFSTPAAEQLDLRPQHPMPRTVEVALGSSAPKDLADVIVSRPQRAYTGPRPARDSSELFSAAQPWLAPTNRILDLGCGPRDQIVAAEHLNLEYVGVDFDSKDADILADAHAVPFGDATFHAVLSYAVLEHLYNPIVAIREISRVMRPGGVFFGAVSQGEPFHASYFHHTAWGVMSLFTGAGFRVERLWASYDTLHALARMGRYARVIRPVIEAVHLLDRATPFLAPRKWISGSARDKDVDALYRAASICFVAVKAVDQ